MFLAIAKGAKALPIGSRFTYFLRQCAEQTQEVVLGTGKAFHHQMKELQEFVEFGMKVSGTAASVKHGSALQGSMSGFS
jgi:hypothetical protein